MILLLKGEVGACTLDTILGIILSSWSQHVPGIATFLLSNGELLDITQISEV